MRSLKDDLDEVIRQVKRQVISEVLPDCTSLCITAYPILRNFMYDDTDGFFIILR